jgi:hypothetical protein
MGMDVNGRKPKNETGKYFRNSVWWWGPLWTYCCSVAPELCSKVKHGYSNDGDGLGARDSSKLAKILFSEIDSGNTQAYAVALSEECAKIPLKICTTCNGTGNRLPPPQIGAGNDPCNRCESTGKIKPWSAIQPFSVENVAAFAAFLANSGGFKIC